MRRFIETGSGRGEVGEICPPALIRTYNRASSPPLKDVYTMLFRILTGHDIRADCK